MKQLRNIVNIRLRAAISPPTEAMGNKDFSNYFRIFKSSDENVEEDNFCSPFFAEGDVISMSEHYGDRKNAMEMISKALHKKVCIPVNLSYDFRLAAVHEEYCTEGEFQYMKRLIEKALNGTGLYLFFMVSHFNQIAGKPPRTKPEHYHLLLCGETKMDESEYNTAANRFVDNLRCDWIDVRLTKQR